MWTLLSLVNFVDGQEAPAVLFCQAVKIPCSGPQTPRIQGSEVSLLDSVHTCDHLARRQVSTGFLFMLCLSKETKERHSRSPADQRTSLSTLSSSLDSAIDSTRDSSRPLHSSPPLAILFSSELAGGTVSLFGYYNCLSLGQQSVH